MSVAILASVIYFSGHMVVARPAQGTAPAPTVAFVPSDSMHEPLLLIRSDDVSAFKAMGSKLDLKGTHLPNGEPGLEISLKGWDVVVGTNTQPALRFQMTAPWDVLRAVMLVAQSADKMFARKATTQESAPEGVTGRVFLRHDGVLETVAPTSGFSSVKWHCSPIAVDCLYQDGQELTDRLRWTSQGPSPVITLRSHGTAAAPQLELENNAQLWFVSRAVTDKWPYAVGPEVPHIPAYGMALEYNKALRTISSETIDAKPVFCPPIMVSRQQ